MDNAAIRELKERLAFAEENLTAWNKIKDGNRAAICYAQNELRQTVDRIFGIKQDIKQLRAALVALGDHEPTDGCANE